MGISVQYWYFEILVLDNCMEILVQYRYFSILVLDSCVGIWFCTDELVEVCFCVWN